MLRPPGAGMGVLFAARPPAGDTSAAASSPRCPQASDAKSVATATSGPVPSPRAPASTPRLGVGRLSLQPVPSQPPACPLIPATVPHLEPARGPPSGKDHSVELRHAWVLAPSAPTPVRADDGPLPAAPTAGASALKRYKALLQAGVRDVPGRRACAAAAVRPPPASGHVVQLELMVPAAAPTARPRPPPSRLRRARAARRPVPRRMQGCTHAVAPSALKPTVLEAPKVMRRDKARPRSTEKGPLPSARPPPRKHGGEAAGGSTQSPVAPLGWQPLGVDPPRSAGAGRVQPSPVEVGVSVPVVEPALGAATGADDDDNEALPRQPPPPPAARARTLPRVERAPQPPSGRPPRPHGSAAARSTARPDQSASVPFDALFVGPHSSPLVGWSSEVEEDGRMGENGVSKRERPVHSAEAVKWVRPSVPDPHLGAGEGRAAAQPRSPAPTAMSGATTQPPSQRSQREAYPAEGAEAAALSPVPPRPPQQPPQHQPATAIDGERGDVDVSPCPDELRPVAAMAEVFSHKAVASAVRALAAIDATSPTPGRGSSRESAARGLTSAAAPDWPATSLAGWQQQPAQPNSLAWTVLGATSRHEARGRHGRPGARRRLRRAGKGSVPRSPLAPYRPGGAGDTTTGRHRASQAHAQLGPSTLAREHAALQRARKGAVRDAMTQALHQVFSRAASTAAAAAAAAAGVNPLQMGRGRQTPPPSRGPMVPRQGPGTARATEDPRLARARQDLAYDERVRRMVQQSHERVGGVDGGKAATQPLPLHLHGVLSPRAEAPAPSAAEQVRQRARERGSPPLLASAREATLRGRGGRGSVRQRVEGQEEEEGDGATGASLPQQPPSRAGGYGNRSCDQLEGSTPLHARLVAGTWQYHRAAPPTQRGRPASGGGTAAPAAEPEEEGNWGRPTAVTPLPSRGGGAEADTPPEAPEAPGTGVAGAAAEGAGAVERELRAQVRRQEAREREHQRESTAQLVVNPTRGPATVCVRGVAPRAEDPERPAEEDVLAVFASLGLHRPPTGVQVLVGARYDRAAARRRMEWEARRHRHRAEDPPPVTSSRAHVVFNTTAEAVHAVDTHARHRRREGGRFEGVHLFLLEADGGGVRRAQAVE